MTTHAGADPRAACRGEIADHLQRAETTIEGLLRALPGEPADERARAGRADAATNGVG